MIIILIPLMCILFLQKVASSRTYFLISRVIYHYLFLFFFFLTFPFFLFLIAIFLSTLNFPCLYNSLIVGHAHNKIIAIINIQSNNLIIFNIVEVSYNLTGSLVNEKGFEPLTDSLEGYCSIQLSYSSSVIGHLGVCASLVYII